MWHQSLFFVSLQLELKLLIFNIMTEDKHWAVVPPCALHTAHYVPVCNGSSTEIMLIFFKCIKANQWEKDGPIYYASLMSL